MQRWALTLLAYEYELLYRPVNENGNADGLSRLPALDVPGSTPVPGDIVHLLETINSSPVDATEALKPYSIRREELSVHAGRLLCEACVIVPPKGEKRC